MSPTNIIPLHPVTPGQRHTVRLNRRHLAKTKPVKSLSVGLRRKGGRNHQGKVTVAHRGGGHKRRYRKVTTLRTTDVALVEGIEWDPNRSASLLRARSQHTGLLHYLLAPEGVNPGEVLESGDQVPLRPGNAMPLRALPLGVPLHNLALFPGKPGQVARAAGCSAYLVQKQESGWGRVRMPSGEFRRISLDAYGTLGTVSQGLQKHLRLGKAGRTRWLGRRPVVRGVAMNPVDHPHGGGEGKTSGGRPSVTPWGRPTKGQPTRKKKHSAFLLRARPKTKA